MKHLINSIVGLYGAVLLTACSSLQQMGQEMSNSFFEGLKGNSATVGGTGAATASSTAAVGGSLASFIKPGSAFNGVRSDVEHANLERIQIRFTKVETDINRVAGEICSLDEDGIKCQFVGNINGNRLNLETSNGNGELRNAKTKIQFLRYTNSRQSWLTFDGSQLIGLIGSYDEVKFTLAK